MKLYARMKGENGKWVGKGSNQRLTIHITGEDRENDIAVFTIWPWRNNLKDNLPHISANVREDITITVENYKGKSKP